jgi:hypothetical protein
MDNVTAYRWKQCVEYMKGVKVGMWKGDEMQNIIIPLIINFGDNSSCCEVLADRDQGTVVMMMTIIWKA